MASRTRSPSPPVGYVDGVRVGEAHGGLVFGGVVPSQHCGAGVGVFVGHGGYSDGGDAPDGSHGGGLTGPWFEFGKQRIRTPVSSGPESTITFGPYVKMSA